MTSPAPAAEHVLELLQRIAARPSPAQATALARELDLPRSSVYKLLGVLRDAGFVTHDEETRRWGLGPAAHELGSAYRRQAPLQRAAQGIVTDLAESTGACAHLVVLHGRDVLYVLEERPLGVPPLVTDVGVRLPATVTASGIAILSALPPAQVRALFPHSSDLVQRREGSEAPATLAQLRAQLAETRRRGYAWENGSVTAGFASVGCPVLDHNGLPTASIAVTWDLEHPSSRARRGGASSGGGGADDADVEWYADACRASAQALTRRLTGGR